LGYVLGMSKSFSILLGLFLFFLYSIQTLASDLMTHRMLFDGADTSNLKHDVYVYQNQEMSDVKWFYGGMAPRMEDPEQIEVVISKIGFTMRVSLYMTKFDIARYPLYLVNRLHSSNRILSENSIQIYPDKRNLMMFEKYQERISKIETEIKKIMPYSQDHERQLNLLYELGLSTLKKYFPTNVLMLPRSAKTDLSKKFGKDIILVAHFVYPITTHRSGSIPRPGVYIQSDNFLKSEWAIEERRTHYSKQNNHIFAGFPAFWFSSTGSGVGVHGPIRYSSIDEKNSLYGSGPQAMRRFWSENEFIKNPLLPPSQSHGKDIGANYRWDLVRTKNSSGCFRAETLELRNILPTSRETIFRHIKWQIIEEFDQIYDWATQTKKIVDVDYYLISPTRKPLARRDWIGSQINSIAQLRREERGRLIDDHIANSYLFEYLDPSSIEMKARAGSSEWEKNRNQGRLNRAVSPSQISL